MEENKFGITSHAVERYIERHQPALDVAQAYEEILLGLASGSKLKKKTYCGHSLWKFGNQNVLAVVRVKNREIVCVTILPPQNQPRLSEFDQSNFNISQEITTVNEALKVEEDLGISAIPNRENLDFVAPLAFVQELEKYKVFLQEYFQSSRFRESVTEEIRESFFNEILDKDRELRHQNYQIQGLIAENACLQKKQEVVNDLLEICLTSVEFILKNKHLPEAEKTIEKIKSIDPSVVEILSKA